MALVKVRKRLISKHLQPVMSHFGSVVGDGVFVIVGLPLGVGDGYGQETEQEYRDLNEVQKTYNDAG